MMDRTLDSGRAAPACIFALEALQIQAPVDHATEPSRRRGSTQGLPLLTNAKFALGVIMLPSQAKPSQAEPSRAVPSRATITLRGGLVSARRYLPVGFRLGDDAHWLTASAGTVHLPNASGE